VECFDTHQNELVSTNTETSRIYNRLVDRREWYLKARATRLPWIPRDPRRASKNVRNKRQRRSSRRRGRRLDSLADGRPDPGDLPPRPLRREGATRGELARLAHVTPSTASSHLSKLVEGGLLEVETWGKHRYFRVRSPEVVRAIEVLALIAPAKPVRSLRQSRSAEAVRFARTCYDHLAGLLGVRFTRALICRGIILEVEDGYVVTEEGLSYMRDFGVKLRSEDRSRFVPRHLDWSKRRHHFAGPLAKATTGRLFELGWIVSTPASRAVRLTGAGRAGLREHFGLILEDDREAERGTEGSRPPSSAV
jgi:DNA-binding transcriptional ArsR family regulator